VVSPNLCKKDLFTWRGGASEFRIGAHFNWLNGFKISRVGLFGRRCEDFTESDLIPRLRWSTLPVIWMKGKSLWPLSWSSYYHWLLRSGCASDSYVWIIKIEGSTPVCFQWLWLLVVARLVRIILRVRRVMDPSKRAQVAIWALTLQFGVDVYLARYFWFLFINPHLPDRFIDLSYTGEIKMEAEEKFHSALWFGGIESFPIWSRWSTWRFQDSNVPAN